MAALPAVADVDALRRLDSNVLGKDGSLGALIRTVKDYPPEQRGQVGKAVNAGKQRVKALIDARMAELGSAIAAADAAGASAHDPTLPGTPSPMGSVHPVTAVQWEIERIFQRLGFAIVGGP